MEKVMTWTHEVYILSREEMWKQMAAISVKCYRNELCVKRFLSTKRKTVICQSLGVGNQGGFYTRGGISVGLEGWLVFPSTLHFPYTGRDENRNKHIVIRDSKQLF